MQEHVDDDVLHPQGLERRDRQPAGHDLPGDALAHQGEGDAQADQPVGDHPPQEGKKEAKSSQVLILDDHVGLVEADDLVGDGHPVACAGRQIGGATTGEADGEENPHQAGAEEIADPDPDPVSDRFAPGGLSCPYGHRQKGKVTRHQLHSEENDAGESEGEDERPDPRDPSLVHDGEGQAQGQSQGGTGVEAPDQQIFDADAGFLATGCNHAVDEFVGEDVIHFIVEMGFDAAGGCLQRDNLPMDDLR